MEQKNRSEKCVFCGNDQLVDSKVSFPEKRQSSAISMTRNGAPSYDEEEYVDFSVKRCSKCGYIHLFHTPKKFHKTTIK